MLLTSDTKLQKLHLCLTSIVSSIARLASQLLSVVMYRALCRIAFTWCVAPVKWLKDIFLQPWLSESGPVHPWNIPLPPWQCVNLKFETEDFLQADTKSKWLEFESQGDWKRSLMLAPPSASFLRHGWLRHHFSICCRFVKPRYRHCAILVTVIIQQFVKQFQHFTLVTLKKHHFKRKKANLCACPFVLIVIRGGGECANYWLVISPICFFSQTGVVPTQITCKAPWNKTRELARDLSPTFISRTKYFLDSSIRWIISWKCFFAGNPSLQWQLKEKLETEDELGVGLGSKAWEKLEKPEKLEKLEKSFSKKSPRLGMNWG